MNIRAAALFLKQNKIAMEKIKDPCISICQYDDNEICHGCSRTKKEAKTWWRMKDEEKLQVLENIKSRAENATDHYDHYV